MPKIAIIEDDQAIAQMYRFKFEAEGFEVQTAENGVLGLELSEKMKPDVILLDLMMPGVDGLEVLRAVKASPDKYGEMPVVVLTNMTSDAVIKEAFDLGASSYLVKTDINYEGLIKELNKYLGE